MIDRIDCRIPLNLSLLCLQTSKWTSRDCTHFATCLSDQTIQSDSTHDASHALLKISQPLQAFFRPILIPVIVLLHGRHRAVERNPRQFRVRIDIDRRRTFSRFIQSPNSDEAHEITIIAIIAPHSKFARWTTRHPLSERTLTGSEIDHWFFGGSDRHEFGLDDCV